MRISTLLIAGNILLAVTSLSASAQQPAAPTGSGPPVARAKSCLESITANSTAERNQKCIALAGPLAVMRDDTLVIRMDDGRRRIFDNKKGHGAEVGFGYGLADFYPATHIFVVCDHGADDGTCTGVDGRTGRQLEFGSAFPQFSPDGNWVLTIDGGGDETESSFAILDVRGNKPVKVWTSKTSKARLPAKPKFVRWENDQTIKLSGDGEKLAFLIQASDGTWRVSKTPSR